MKIGGELDPRAMQKKHWELFADEVAIKPKLVLTRLKELSQRVEAARLPLFKGELEPFRCDTLHRLMELIADQCSKAVKQAGD